MLWWRGKSYLPHLYIDPNATTLSNAAKTKQDGLSDSIPLSDFLINPFNNTLANPYKHTSDKISTNIISYSCEHSMICDECCQ
jgi:hypothetical protein